MESREDVLYAPHAPSKRASTLTTSTSFVSATHKGPQHLRRPRLSCAHMRYLISNTYKVQRRTKSVQSFGHSRATKGSGSQTPGTSDNPLTSNSKQTRKQARKLRRK
eukprot:5195123-Pyramimonas_sp.AAC.1